MRLEDKILLPTGSLTVGVIMDIISLLCDYETLFALGTTIIAISLLIITLVLYYELTKYKGEK